MESRPRRSLGLPRLGREEGPPSLPTPLSGRSPSDVRETKAPNALNRRERGDRCPCRCSKSLASAHYACSYARASRNRLARRLRQRARRLAGNLGAPLRRHTGGTRGTAFCGPSRIAAASLPRSSDVISRPSTLPVAISTIRLCQLGGIARALETAFGHADNMAWREAIRNLMSRGADFRLTHYPQAGSAVNWDRRRRCMLCAPLGSS